MFYDLGESGMRIKALRIQKGFTQEQLSERLGISRNFLGNVEVGKTGCSVDMLIQLSELFSVPIDYIVLGRKDTFMVRTEVRSKILEVMECLKELMKVI